MQLSKELKTFVVKALIAECLILKSPVRLHISLIGRPKRGILMKTLEKWVMKIRKFIWRMRLKPIKKVLMTSFQSSLKIINIIRW